MRTECKQVRFEFHQLSQRKVKARFDGGKITSDAGVLLLREVERGTGLIAGLAECFRDHRDARLIEHTVEELLGQRIYGLCLGYEDLNHVSSSCSSRGASHRCLMRCTTRFQ